MKLRVNTRDPKLVEDDFGNPIFRFLSIHTCDLNEIVEKYNVNGEDIQQLRDELEEAEDKLREIRGITYEY